MDEGDQGHLQVPSHLPSILASLFLKHSSTDSKSQKFGRSLRDYLGQLSTWDGTDIAMVLKSQEELFRMWIPKACPQEFGFKRSKDGPKNRHYSQMIPMLVSC